MAPQTPWQISWGKIDIKPQGSSFFVPGQLAVNYTQPAFSPQKRWLVVGDVWLTNRDFLLNKLGITYQDCLGKELNLIAWLCQELGASCVEILEGIFSLGIWDNHTNQLWLARDRTGGKTLYYASNNSTYHIGSKLASLSQFHSKEVDLIALRDYLCCAFVPGENTLWQGVKELRPGSILTLPSGKVNYYWQPKEEIIAAPLEWHSQRLRGHLDSLMSVYLPQGDPVGVFLSGGLDSSCITALAAKFHQQPIHTYSIHFGTESPNELEFSSLVAQHCNTRHHILEITPKKMWEKLPITMSHLDDPIGDPLTVPNYLLGQLATEEVEVILNGEGGDPCFGGPKNQPMLLNQLYGGDQEVVTAYLNSFQKCAADLPKLLSPPVWESIKHQPSIFAQDLTSEVQYLNRLMLLNIKYKGADQILTKVNNLTTALGLEGRSPLFDQNIVSMSLQIPPEYKLMNAQEKAVLKQAVGDLLPLVIIERPKSGMMVPVQLCFRKYWQRQAKGLLLSKKAAIAPYFNQAIIKQWLNYEGDVWGRYGVKLWLLVSLEIWLKINR